MSVDYNLVNSYAQRHDISHDSQSEADKIYRLGIERRARPFEKLKKLYQHFQERSASAAASIPTSSGTAKVGTSSESKNRSSKQSSKAAVPADSYSRMKGPPVAGKRRETLRLDLSLLMTEDGVEYSNAEARARSLGLLGKKWGPLSLPPQKPGQPQSKVPVNFNDDGQTKATTRKSLGIREPTVTINTKEALADGFGMFNSPEKTIRSRQTPGSKHAPVKRVEPVTPVTRPPQTPSYSDGRIAAIKTPG